MSQVSTFEPLLMALGWGLLTLFRVSIPLIMLGTAIWAARRLPPGIGGALIVGTSVTLLSSLVSALVFSPLGMSRVSLNTALFSYISVGLNIAASLGGLCFAGGFLALALWLPEKK